MRRFIIIHPRLRADGICIPRFYISPALGERLSLSARCFLDRNRSHLCVHFSSPYFSLRFRFNSQSKFDRASWAKTCAATSSASSLRGAASTGCSLWRRPATSHRFCLSKLCRTSWRSLSSLPCKLLVRACAAVHALTSKTWWRRVRFIRGWTGSWLLSMKRSEAAVWLLANVLRVL